ncbi:PRC-barrel [Propionibacterium freudenreichii]|nr:PRC-barrel [Propionibacterium freudenreichii]
MGAASVHDLVGIWWRVGTADGKDLLTRRPADKEEHSAVSSTDRGYDHLYGARVIDRDGAFVGDVAQVYTDQVNGEALAVTVRTGLFGARRLLVPLINAAVGWHRIDVPYLRAHVNSAPPAGTPVRSARDAYPHLSPVTEAEIAAHYELTTLR